ncbi:hypothetical protein JYT22_00350 [Endomicrobium sp. AH-315-J14]|nr:hypothetical protein [Endomicrobium sp. AH-315-J14]
MTSCAEIKTALKQAGFEVYRTRPTEVHIAERVRNNLIMDSGILVEAEGPTVVFHTRAQQADFPGDVAAELYERAASLGSTALELGYAESKRFVTEMPDPSNPSKTLDSWYQVKFCKRVSSLEEAMAEVGFSSKLVKVASH